MRWVRDRVGWNKDTSEVRPPQVENADWHSESDEEFEVIEPEELDWERVEVHEGGEVGAIFRGANIATYNLQLFAPDIKVEPGEPFPERPPVHRETEQDKRVLADLPAMLETVEETLENLLPVGYSVRITEWNK